jgi:hypothetical protein
MHFLCVNQEISQKPIKYEFRNKRLRGKPRSKWQDEVRGDGRIVGGEWWQEKVYYREVWKKLLRMARNCCILLWKVFWLPAGRLSITHTAFHVIYILECA